MSLALRKVSYNFHYKAYFSLSEWTTTQRVHLKRQDKGMSLCQYYERFKIIADTADYVNNEMVIGNGMKDFATIHQI